MKTFLLFLDIQQLLWSTAKDTAHDSKDTLKYGKGEDNKNK